MFLRLWLNFTKCLVKMLSQQQCMRTVQLVASLSVLNVSLKEKHAILMVKQYPIIIFFTF